MNIAVLLAGGVGKRLGAGKPKQFVELMGRPMILYAMEIYERSPLIDALEVVCVPDYIDYVWELARENGITKLKWVCAGGADCQESTRNGIFNLEGVCAPDDMLTVNMSSSIFVSEEILEDSFRVARERGSAFACLRCVYNNAETEDGVSSTKINFKESNHTINMPWTASFAKLDAMYHKAYEEGIEIGETAYMPTLFLALGEPLYFSMDDGLNKIHVQRPADLYIAEAVLEYRKNHGEA
ncbi:MAG: 2-C-methyl-D-erythritol 4-phosphate cytidylyltransferase [Clostridia bacterium]|nr:2-C-methyl-D-erythritol 4-phosphate cytidylyltransferase [Clostridia bacterium]